MSNDNIETEKRVTRLDGIPQVEWLTGRRQGEPVRKYTIQKKQRWKTYFFNTTTKNYTRAHRTNTIPNGEEIVIICPRSEIMNVKVKVKLNHNRIVK